VVPLTPANLLSSRVTELSNVVRQSFDDAGPTSRGFAVRLLGTDKSAGGIDLAPIDIEGAIADAAYNGVPAIAMAGFGVGRHEAPIGLGTFDAFIRAIDRMRGRPSGGREQIGDDDVAILGIADGLARIAATRPTQTGEMSGWLIEIADGHSAGPTWSRRIRALAADLLDHRGRLRADPFVDDVDVLALDLCLRKTWPVAFETTGYLSRENQQKTMAELLIRPAPVIGELERAAVWLGALVALVGEAATALVPDVNEVVRMLLATQGALKRWVWEAESARAKVDPARWLIDNEAHVQAFLWAILYPIFSIHLRDEQYLPGFGLKQPRYDFGITNLKLIVEVKLTRAPGDFKKVEEEIAGDVGIYFSDPARFNRMVAYIYDDCDSHHPELYDTLRNALRQRDARIIDVVIVRRPGMIPDRAQRKSNQTNLRA